MIILGLILLVLGLLLKISILWTIGIIVLIVGLVLVVAGSMGRAVGGRRHYWQPDELRLNACGPFRRWEWPPRVQSVGAAGIEPATARL